MIKNIASVLAGSALWAFLWCTGNALAMASFPWAFDAQGATSSTPLLLAFILFATLLSMLAGRLTHRIARSKAPVWALAMLQLSIGLFVELSYWSLLPVWYHVIFLALIVPATVGGGASFGVGHSVWFRRRSTSLART